MDQPWNTSTTPVPSPHYDRERAPVIRRLAEATATKQWRANLQRGDHLEYYIAGHTIAQRTVITRILRHGDDEKDDSNDATQLVPPYDDDRLLMMITTLGDPQWVTRSSPDIVPYGSASLSCIRGASPYERGVFRKTHGEPITYEYSTGVRRLTVAAAMTRGIAYYQQHRQRYRTLLVDTSVGDIITVPALLDMITGYMADRLVPIVDEWTSQLRPARPTVDDYRTGNAWTPRVSQPF